MAHLAIFGFFLILSVSAWMVWFLKTRKVPEKKYMNKNTSPPCHPKVCERRRSGVRCGEGATDFTGDLVRHLETRQSVAHDGSTGTEMLNYIFLDG